MHPDLISLGFLHLKTYGAFMALGFLAAWQVVAWLCRRMGRDPEPCTNLIMWMMVSGVVGSRIAYVIEHWSQEFAGHPELLVRIDQGGLMFYGGFILALAVFVVWCRVKREPIVPMADLFAVVIPLGHAFGRVGCFFYGCCYGRVSAHAFAVAYPRRSPAWVAQVEGGLVPETAQSSLAVLPTQLFEAGAVLCLFAVLLFIFLRNWKTRPGLTTGCYLVGYACIRFGIEFLRDDMRQQVGALSIGQTISIGLFLLGFVFIFVSLLRSRAENCKIIGPTN